MRSHYLNQWWQIVNWNTFRWNFKNEYSRNSHLKMQLQITSTKFRIFGSYLQVLLSLLWTCTFNNSTLVLFASPRLGNHPFTREALGYHRRPGLTPMEGCDDAPNWRPTSFNAFGGAWGFIHAYSSHYSQCFNGTGQCCVIWWLLTQCTQCSVAHRFALIIIKSLPLEWSISQYQ